MQANRLISALFISAACLFALGPATRADDDVNVGELTPLSDDLSPSELFGLVKDAAEAEDPNLGDEIQKFSLYGPFQFPNDVLYDVIENKPRTGVIFGIDLSHHNKAGIPFAKLLQKRVKFAYVKATQGERFVDGKFAGYWSSLGNVKVHRGAYHFLSAGGDPVSQAKTFAAVVKAGGGLRPQDMPPALDLEWDKAGINAPDRWEGVAANEIIRRTKKCLEEIERRTGRRPILYTARAWWRERIGSEAKFTELAGYKVWIADYSMSSRGREVPKVPNNSDWLIWQFTDAAEMAQGYEGGFDANVFKGEESEFYQRFGVARF